MTIYQMSYCHEAPTHDIRNIFSIFSIDHSMTCRCLSPVLDLMHFLLSVELTMQTVPDIFSSNPSVPLSKPSFICLVCISSIAITRKYF